MVAYTKIYVDMTDPKTPIYCSICGKNQSKLTQITAEEAKSLFKGRNPKLTCLKCQKTLE